ncbi:CoA transferase subunit A [Falsiroseomonas sp. CW058]|uniref:CoA transferase subunit A n=1 Tax=Falsiroseomonas sp. CW058 TaxID=3388664 RepID=UPI003D31F836
MPQEDLAALVARVPDGAMVVVPPNYSGVAVAATRALAARGVRGLHLLASPSSGIQADLLIAAGCVATMEAAAVSLDEFGPAPAFTAAVRAGTIRMLDSTCPAIHAALGAAEKGLPFIPLRGLIGSDVLRHRADWKVIQNPFAGTEDPIVLLPALRPDIALFHAVAADREGNVRIGRRRELAVMAHAARRTLVTVERIEEGCFFDREEIVAGVLPALYVTALSVVPRGAWPLGLDGEYDIDAEAMRRHARGDAP